MTMPLQLDSHFVAFIDILGFSEMVRKDCESAEDPRYLQLLYESHVSAAALFGQDLESGLIQFSDSIVFSKPFNLRYLDGFISSIAEWQKSLLLKGLLCRGGIAFGKHFVKDKFLFSKAMIDAYTLESSLARYPRIVVSEDLLQLATGTVQLDDLMLRREDDGSAFVDYLRTNNIQEKKDLAAAIDSLAVDTAKMDSSVKEKLRWLSRYSDHAIGTDFSVPQFSRSI